MKKKKNNFPFKPLIIIGIIFLASILIVGYIWKSISRGNYFLVKNIIARNSEASKFNYFLGKNIFDLDLKKESRKILAGCVYCRKVRIAKILPDRLFIDLIKREPVAVAKFYRYFAIDQEGVFFYTDSDSQNSLFPVIYGLETKIFGPKPGASYNKKEVRLALTIIKEFNANRYLKGFELKRIDVANAENASFFMLLPQQTKPDYTKVIPLLPWTGFEVKVGENNVKEKMAILSGVIAQAGKELVNIKYVDLRFKEPVIKLIDVK